RRPSNTLEVLTASDVLSDIKEKIKEYNGKCNCILKITITDHGGMQGQITVGKFIISPDLIQQREYLRRIAEKNPKDKKALQDDLDKFDELENFFKTINSYMCEDKSSIEFGHCKGYSPETQKYLEALFSDHVKVILHENRAFFWDDQEIHDLPDRIDNFLDKFQ
ncbi:MAG: hypothetical protein Q7U02_13605, partial [Desulfosalsimonadaceae bacterium]|nr:hypothetical protein [Desulfosalsimonadaceae bacterium]